MEKDIGSGIKAKIEAMRAEIEEEIENSKKSLIKSLKKESSGLIRGIDEREKELLRRVEKILDQELKKSRWKVYVLIFALGLVLGVGSAATITYWKIHKNNVVLSKEWEHGFDQQNEWYIRTRRQ